MAAFGWAWKEGHEPRVYLRNDLEVPVVSFTRENIDGKWASEKTRSRVNAGEFKRLLKNPKPTLYVRIETVDGEVVCSWVLDTSEITYPGAMVLTAEPFCPSRLLKKGV